MTAPARSFADRLRVQCFDDASYFAGPLFEESFHCAFPVAPSDPVPAGWRQYVAFYRWDDDRIEPVGFCNYAPFEGLWLEGGLCVRRSFYGRLPPGDSEACRAAGGVAQLIMEAAARDLNACEAWFAYCGDERSLRVCKRVGFEETAHRYVIARWFRVLPAQRKSELIDKVADLGPF